MKIGSMHTILNDASTTFKRFPFAIICSIAGTLCMLMVIETDYTQKDNMRVLTQLMLTFSLGMVASLATDLFSQRYYVRNRTQIVFNFVILALMMLFYTTLPQEITLKAGARIFILSLAAHLAVSFAPFIVNDEPNGFWQFNKSLFLRFLTSVLYTTVLFIGIGLALLAIENLFKINVPDNLYFKILIVLAGVFNTWFFLAGIPRQIGELETRQDYPRGLKIFTQYVLLPLITLYFVILYAYTIRILLTHDWPVGWVCYLVLGFSIAGILALLLVWPLRDDETHRWIKTYTQKFYFALFPLIILLFVSIGKRIAQYGITENRYFIIVLALWLLVVALYFLISSLKRIKFIPITLFGFVLLAGFSPFNAFSISESNQLNRLTKILEKNGLFSAGKVYKSSKKIAFEDEQKISSVLDYLTQTHGVESVQHLFNQNIETLCNKDSTLSYVDYSSCIMESIGMKYISRYESETTLTNDEKVFSFNIQEQEALKVEGYDFLVNYTLNTSNADVNNVIHQHFLIAKDSISVEISASRKQFTVVMSDSTRLMLNLGAMVSLLLSDGDFNQYDIQPEKLTLQQAIENYRVQLIITSIGGSYLLNDSNNQLNYLQGKLMVGKIK